MSESLDQLRDQLRKVDAKLLELMAERQQLSGKIGAVKRAAGRATRDYQQEREVVKRARKAGEALGLPGEVAEERTVRFRTVGDLTLTGCVESSASTIDQIIDEIAVARVTERGATRGDDRFSEAAMEDRKKEGYF